MVTLIMKKIILGASGSIGSSLAKKLVDAGDEIHLVGRDESSISSLAGDLGASFTVCDVLEENFSEKILSDIGEEPINGLAYCIGSIDLKPLKLTKKSDFLKAFNLNLVSAAEVIKTFGDNLKQNKGSVVLFSTVAVKQGFPNHAIVSSAKGAIEGLTIALAAEFAPNIRVNCIAPSLTNSKMSSNLLKNEKIAEGIASLTPQQFRVLIMLMQGLLNKQIAYELNVSEATIKAHVTAILRKLSVHSRTQAVIAAQRLCVDPPRTDMA